MNTLAEKSELLYVGAAQSRKSPPQFSLGNSWRFKAVSFRDVVEGTAPRCDFIWLNLGRLKKAANGYEILKEVASLKGKTAPCPYVFISGNGSESIRRRLLQSIIDSFPDLSNLKVDLVGGPDVLSALTMFSALKTRRTTSATENPAPRVKVPNADLRSDRGRLSAKVVSDVLGVTTVTLGEWIGSNKAALSKTPDAPAIQDKLQVYARIASFREAVGGDVLFKQWLRTPHEMLEGKTPLSWLEKGKALEIAEFVEEALAGQLS